MQSSTVRKREKQPCSQTSQPSSQLSTQLYERTAHLYHGHATPKIQGVNASAPVALAGLSGGSPRRALSRRSCASCKKFTKSWRREKKKKEKTPRSGERVRPRRLDPAPAAARGAVADARDAATFRGAARQEGPRGGL